mgnify:CR=1 FL=1
MTTLTMKARYIRISTPDQKYERQLVKQHPDERIFIDVCSGSIPFKERTQGKILLESNISYVSVHAIDRLGRNLIDILNTLKTFRDNGVTLKVDNLGLESMVGTKPNQAFDLIVTVMGQVAQMERETLKERRDEGIAIAKAEGRYKGRVRGSVDSDEETLAKYPNVIKRLKEGQSLRNTAKLCEVSKATVIKVKKIVENT